jgi:hypothetical protein
MKGDRTSRFIPPDLDGWVLTALMDGYTVSADGQKRWTYWHEYTHADGRRAVVSANGSCTDPELQKLLGRRAVQTAPRGKGVLMLRLTSFLCLGLKRIMNYR